MMAVDRRVRWFRYIGILCFKGSAGLTAAIETIQEIRMKLRNLRPDQARSVSCIHEPQ